MGEKYRYRPDEILELSDEQLADMVPGLHEAEMEAKAREAQDAMMTERKAKWDKEHPGEPMIVIPG